MCPPHFGSFEGVGSPSSTLHSHRVAAMVILDDVGPHSYASRVREDFNWIMDGVVLLLLLPTGLLPLNKPNCFYKG